MSYELIGPFQHHDVVVDGWRVPYLTAEPLNGGVIHLSLDNRFGLDVGVQEAEQVIPFIADCIAVALGFSAHPGKEGLPEPLPLAPFRRMYGLL